MIRDTFSLENDIDVQIQINVDNSLLVFEVVIDNRSSKRVMLYNKYFRFGRHFYFADQNGDKGDVGRGVHRQYDWDINIGAIDLIEPNATARYKIQRKYKKTGDTFMIFDDEGDIIFKKPELVKIVIKHDHSEREIQEIKKIVNDAIILPDFSKSYVIIEYK